MDIEGRKEPLRARPANYQELNLSRDGKRVALSAIDGGGQDLWIYDPQRDSMARLTSGGESYRYPLWSPDGLHLVFTWAGHGLYQTRADGASQPLPLTASTAAQYALSFTSDGKRLAYHELAGTRQLWTLPLQDEGGHLKAGTPEPFLKSGSTDVAPSFSPDGRWLAYQSDESGTNEVYVRAFSPASASPPGAAGQDGVSTSLKTGKWQISNAGGTQPRWSRSGHDLIYQSGDQLMAARYTATGDTFAAEKPRVWLAKLGAGQNRFGSAAWDLAPDGKRVIVAVPVEASEAPKQEHEVVFLENFVDELSRRVPLGK